MNYRQEAHLRLAASSVELANGDDGRLKYAALELRMAIEALTYDRALAYKDEFPPEEYQTWQPRKVMAVLLEIDSSVDADKAIAIGREFEQGEAAPVMHSLGTESVFNMVAIRKHYDALGSYLHLPSIKQMKAQSPVDFGRLRERCVEIFTEIEKALSSSVFNVTLGEFARFDCIRCQHPIRRRLARDQSEVAAECFECHATYAITKLPSGEIQRRAKRQDLNCGRDGCTGVGHFWDSDLQVGNYWKCRACGGRNVVTLSQHYESPG